MDTKKLKNIISYALPDLVLITIFMSSRNINSRYP